MKAAASYSRSTIGSPKGLIRRISPPPVRCWKTLVIPPPRGGVVKSETPFLYTPAGTINPWSQMPKVDTSAGVVTDCLE